MGLDSYAARPVTEDGQRRLTTDLPGRVVYTSSYKHPDGTLGVITHKVAAGFESVPSLAGGIFSGNGCDGSFRGKCYAGLVEEVTGYSLYEDELPPPVVLEMARMLREASDERPLPGSAEEALKELREQANDDVYPADLASAYDLYAMACFFEACASQGYSVVSWY